MWLRLLHTAENHGPTMFHMATVSHKRWDPCLLYRTSLMLLVIKSMYGYLEGLSDFLYEKHIQDCKTFLRWSFTVFQSTTFTAQL